MYVLRRSVDGMILLSDHAREALGRRLSEIGGLALIFIAALAVIALATWSVDDPSLSNATSGPARNVLGRGGAIAADLMMQMLGVAALALILPVGLWGWRLVSHRRLDRQKLRFAAWLIGTPLAAIFAACLPVSKNWPLPTGLGGLIGDSLLRLPVSLFGTSPGAAYLPAALICGALAFVALGFAAGLGWHEADGDDEEPARYDPRADEKDDEGSRGFVSLGFLYHGFLSLRSRFLRLLRVRPLAHHRDDRLGARRVEPRLHDEGMIDEESFEDEIEVEDETQEDEDASDLPIERPARKRSANLRQMKSRRTGNGYELPDLALLTAARAHERYAPSDDQIKETATSLEGVLQDFGVRGEIINAHPGPVVTLYELEPAPGIKSSRVIGLSDDIARSMSAISARVAVVAGRNAIGIELPNPRREKVYLRELLSSEDYTSSNAKLPLCLGKTIGGDAVIVDLARMPHLLIAGTTGSGKSVAINTMILSLLYRWSPDQCRLIMVDPKMLELSVYDNIPHLLTPVVTDPKKAVVALKWAVREMEGRYKKMSKLGVRNIDGYNARVAEASARGETLTRTVHTGYDKESGEAIYEKEELDLETLPYIVVIVDEMADLMMVAGKDIEGAIQRLAQMARAAGIHVILATQRPSVDVITGTIKANFPTRVSFQVTSKIDSRTILGEQGAEQLLGQGDMLYMAGGGRISRVHGPFVSDEEVEKIVRHLKTQGVPQYLEEVTAGDVDDEDEAVFDATAMGQEGGDLYSQAVQIVIRDRKASTSYIQRRLQIGYNRAASIMEKMEKESIVGAPNHAGKREILVGGDDDGR